MCKLEEIIKNILTSPSANLLSKNVPWNNARNTSYSNITWTIRKNIIAQTICTYKYLEYTEWDPKKHKCVAIGFNPATIDVNEIDKTNEKIIDKLKEKGYGGYILLNLSPQCSTSKKEWCDNDDEDLKYFPCFIKILKIISKKSINVLIFWGRTVAIKDDIYNILQKIIKTENLLMTVKEGTQTHYHPAYVPIDIIPVTDTNLKSSHYLQ